MSVEFNNSNKWICIVRISKDNSFTFGKIYEGEELIGLGPTCLKLKDDRGRDSTPYKFNFISLDEWRQIQIDNILD